MLQRIPQTAESIYLNECNTCLTKAVRVLACYEKEENLKKLKTNKSNGHLEKHPKKNYVGLIIEMYTNNGLLHLA